MAVDFAGINLKIQRAKQLRQELNGEIAAAFDEDNYTFERKIEDICKVVYYVHNVPQVNPMWTVAISEMVHHLRTSLDHLAYQLVLHDGKTPNRRTQFPVMDNAPTTVMFDLNPSVSQDIRDAVEKHQPYGTCQSLVAGDLQVF